MSNECVVAVYGNLDEARAAVHALERSDFPSGQVSLIANEIPSDFELARRIKPEDDSIRDAVVGGGIGAVIGAVAGTAVSVIVGPFSGGLLGVVVGSFIGSMAGWGVHEENIRQYEDMLAEGKVLVVAYGNPLELIHAQNTLTETTPEDVHFNARTSSESPEVNPAENLPGPK